MQSEMNHRCRVKRANMFAVYRNRISACCLAWVSTSKNTILFLNLHPDKDIIIILIFT